jgi:hypothetical protein
MSESVHFFVILFFARYTCTESLTIKKSAIAYPKELETSKEA